MHSRIKAEIISEATSHPSEEICGFIYRDPAGNPQIFRCKNVAANPTEEFEIGMQDNIAVLGLGHVLGVYHSHPAPSSGLSQADIECAEEMALPFYIYDVAFGKWHEFIPSSYSVKLTGEPWCLGFSDCYETVRIFFRQECGIYIGDYDRDESFSHEERGIINSSYDLEGFVKIPISNIENGDMLVFKTDKALPQHFGIYLSGNRFIHHPRDGLSKEEILSDRWLSRVVGAFRHKLMRKSVQNPCNS